MSTTIDYHSPMVADIELKDEIILAMANELRQLRQQLLEHTNVPLRPRRADEQHGDEMTLDSLHCQLDDVLRTREKERTLHTETLNSVVAELASLRKRYEETKRALEAGQWSTKTQTRPSGSSTESPMDTDTETIAEEEFQVASFLSTHGTLASGHFPPVDFYESPVGVNLWAALRKELSDTPVVDRVLHPDIVIWQGGHLGARRCLLLYPSQRFTLSDKSTKAEGCTQNLEQGATREIICKVDKTWGYCGTYKCVGILNASEEDVNQLDPPHTIMNGIMQRTVTFAAKGAIPAHVGKLVREMYRSGTLSLRCYGMELVDRVEALDDALETCAIRRTDAKRPSDGEEEGSRKKQKSL